jgi:hypothetical protein
MMALLPAIFISLIAFSLCKGAIAACKTGFKLLRGETFSLNRPIMLTNLVEAFSYTLSAIVIFTTVSAGGSFLLALLTGGIFIFIGAALTGTRMALKRANDAPILWRSDSTHNHPLLPLHL